METQEETAFKREDDRKSLGEEPLELGRREVFKIDGSVVVKT